MLQKRGKMAKQFFSVLLIVSMILSQRVNSPIVYAGVTGGSSNIWDGSADTSWGDGNPDTYTIMTAEQLARFAELVNGGDDFSGKTVTLGADIVLNDTSNWESWNDSTTGLKAWSPISISTNKFEGTFDGGGHTVSGIYINNFSNYQGLFGYLGSNSKITNVGVTDSYIKGSSFNGSVVGYCPGTVESCYNTGNVSSIGGTTGGLVGSNTGTVERCYNAGNVSSTGMFVGGIIGDNSGTITNCYNTGNITGASRVGGVVGYTSGTISKCYNVGPVNGTSRSGAVIGVVSGACSFCYYESNTSVSTGFGLAKPTEWMKNASNIAGYGDDTDTFYSWSSDIWLFEDNQYPQLKMGVQDTFSVTFDSLGGSDVQAITNLKNGDKITKPSDPTRIGMIFAGWYRDRGYTSIWDFDTDTVSESFSLYAKWTESQTFTVTYDANGGTGTVPVDNRQYYVGDTVVLAVSGSVISVSGGAITLDNHSFGGWSTTRDGGAVGSTYTMGNADVIFYAVWIEDGKYTVTYDANGGSGIVPTDSNQYYQGTSVNLKNGDTLSKIHYTFTGWAQSRAATVVSGSAITIGSSNITLYAIWTEKPTYQVTYNSNGGYGSAPVDSAPYHEGDSVTLPSGNGISKADYRFEGWSTTPSGNATSGSTYTMGTANIIFYAVWKYSPTSSPTTSTTPTPTKKVRQVDVNGINASSTSTVASVDIIRETKEDKSVDTVVLEPSKTEEILKKVVEQKQSTVQIVIEDIPEDPADEVEVTISADSIQKISDSEVSLEIRKEGVTLKVSAETLKELSEEEKELYFRVVPIRDPEEQDKTIQNAINTAIVLKEAGNSEVKSLGTPMIIETNYQKLSTKVIFSLEGIDIPKDQVQRASFLASLGVYINHSDGEQELNHGTIVYDEEGNPIGIEIEITKFSTFTIVSIENTAPTATKLKLKGNAAIGKKLTLAYTYLDHEKDQQGDSVIAWYRADNKNGKNLTLIKEGTAKTYTLTKKDQEKYILVEVTPVAKTGKTTGSTASVYIKVNQAPKATDAAITGIMAVGKKLTVRYTYSDVEKDKEGTTTIQWYRADDVTGNKRAAIKGANKSSYTLTAKEEGKYISVEITPVASAGTVQGKKATVAAQNPVVQPEVKYTSYVKLGVIKSKTYAEQVAKLFENNYGKVKAEMKKEGKYYRVYLDFTGEEAASAACKDMKEKKYIINYYFYTK